jgi:hypothetical protein
VAEQDNLPSTGGRRGRYEVWFATLSDRSTRTGYWIRHTVRTPISGPPEPRVWFAAFSLDDPAATFGLNRGFPAGQLQVITEPFEVRVGESVFGTGRLAGGISDADRDVRWDLRFATGGPTLRLLPDALYREPLLPTRPYAPNPATSFTGEILVDGERRVVHGVPGQQGHLVGTRHAERWAWASCPGFDDEGVAFHALSAQGRRGPVLTPFVTSAALRWGGRWIRLHGVSRRRTWGLGWWRLSLGGRRYRLEGEVRGEPKAMIQARYLDPDDTPRWCHNSEVASCRLTLWERRAGGWQGVAELASDGTTHAEWAGRTPAPGVEAVHRAIP